MIFKRLFNGRLLTIVDYLYDIRRFIKYARNNRSTLPSEKQFQARLMAKAHGLEKGFSVAETKPGFGKVKVEGLISEVQHYVGLGYDTSALSYRMSVSVLKYYLDHTSEIDAGIAERIRELWESTGWVEPTASGCITYEKAEVLEYGKAPFKIFSQHRHSVRHYSQQSVDGRLIKEAVELAIRSPSVCNRQSFRVHMANSTDTVKKLSELQNGNRGFGDKAATMLIVTAELQSFFDGSERNQAYIDGGLFSMSLLYALHAQGLGACPLNWSVHFRQDAKLREAFVIPESEVVIMLISVGHLPDRFCVAKSERLDVEGVLKPLVGR